jgi:hypothetical protein
MNRWLFLLFLLAYQAVPAVAQESSMGQGQPPQNRTGDWKVAPVSGLHKLAATAPGVLEPFPTTPVQLRAVRDEWECFQVVVTAGAIELRDVRLVATGLATTTADFVPSTNIKLFRENFVRAEKPSGNRRMEKLWWPDALIPLEWQPKVNIPELTSAAFWVAVYTPRDAYPGTYFGAIDVASSSGEKQLFVALTVEHPTLPAGTMRANAALYYDVVREWYANNLQPISDDEFKAIKTRYYDFLKSYRINAYDLPVAWDDPAVETYLRDPASLSVRTPPLTSPDFATAIAVLKKSDALGKGYYYYLDEPSPEAYPAVREAAEKLRTSAPGLKHVVTVHPNDALHGAVDIWCPNIGDWAALGHLDLAQLARERAQGRETWWYTMVEPRAPYPTWLLEDEASSVRLYGWMMARWGISGFVYSMVHGWGPKPLENLQSFADTNGDGTLLYPGELVGGSGPMPSIRLMLLRDAIEDYELLQTLSPQVRDAVTSHVVGLSPTQRIDAATQWQNGTYRALLVDALAGKAIRARTAPTLPLRSITIQNIAKAPLKAPRIDGMFSPGEWPTRLRQDVDFQRFTDDSLAPAPVQMWTAQDTDNFYAAFRVQYAQPTGEWSAVELATYDASERWRFIVNNVGNGLIERHTREGRFRIEGLDWKWAQRSYPAAESSKTLNNSKTLFIEMQIPLEPFGKSYRFNALRRVNDTARDVRYITRAVDDVGDATLMPVVR